VGVRLRECEGEMSAEESESEREEAEEEVQEGERREGEDERKGKRYFVRRNTQASTAYTNTYTDAHTPSAPPSPSSPTPPPHTQVEITMRDLENAIHTINKFASLYRRAVSAIENLERAEKAEDEQKNVALSFTWKVFWHSFLLSLQ